MMAALGSKALITVVGTTLMILPTVAVGLTLLTRLRRAGVDVNKTKLSLREPCIMLIP